MLTFYSQNIWNMNPAGYRNKLVRSLVADFRADVCAFQECGPVTSRAACPSIGALMGDAFAEAVPEAAAVNDTPVFYRVDKFRLPESAVPSPPPISGIRPEAGRIPNSALPTPGS